MKLARMIITASAVLAIGLAAGCKKDEKKGDAPAAAPKAENGTPTAPAADKPADPPAAPAAMTGSVEEMAAKAVTMMETLAKAAVDNKGDCDKQAAAMQKVMDDNKALIAAGKEFDKDPAKKKQFDEMMENKAPEVMGPMMEALAPCGEHEGMKKVFEAFED